jgi:hypothetical protein
LSLDSGVRARQFRQSLPLMRMMQMMRMARRFNIELVAEPTCNIQQLSVKLAFMSNRLLSLFLRFLLPGYLSQTYAL